MKYNYNTTGTCSTSIDVDYHEENGIKILDAVSFTGGCNGNLKGIGELVKGMSFDDVITRLDGLTCKTKPTSCPDQLAQALKEISLR